MIQRSQPALHREHKGHRSRLRHYGPALLATVLLLAGGAVLARAGWMQAKAVLAQYLIHNAWSRTLAGAEQVRPWPWADTWPVARLTTPDGEHLYVLEGLTGHALAFGPARLAAGYQAGRAGTMVVAGHKDSHFRFLRNLEHNDLLRVQTASGQQYGYRVRALRVADNRVDQMELDHERDELMLVTCYPFGSGDYDSPWRYIVRAERI